MDSRRAEQRVAFTENGVDQERAMRVLLVHNVAAATCDALARVIETALGGAELVDASSMDDARAAVAAEAFDAILICLDLPPAPLAGARLASELLERGLPIVLVTRSLRWLPPDATALRELPWIAPDAPPEDVARVIAAVSPDCDSVIRVRADLKQAAGDPARAARG